MQERHSLAFLLHSPSPPLPLSPYPPLFHTSPQLLFFSPSPHAVPPPTIILGAVGEPYNGTTHSLTCTVTVDNSVDTNISISSWWNYSRDMTSSDIITNTTERRGLRQHTNLTFNPLRSQDGRRYTNYTCTVDIDLTNATAFVLGNSGSENTSISVQSELQ